MIVDNYILLRYFHSKAIGYGNDSLYSFACWATSVQEEEEEEEEEEEDKKKNKKEKKKKKKRKKKKMNKKKKIGKR